MKQIFNKQEEKKKKQKTVVVLGMHRSGTSVIAGLLKILGVHMGERFEEGDNFNVRGYFEDLDIREVNESILKEIGGSWHQPPHNKEINEYLGDRIKKICAGKKGLWGWKDPRTVLLLEYYLPHLENPYFIICRRNEEEIVLSLMQRDKFPKEKCKYIINDYNARIDSFLTQNKQYPVLKFNFSEVKKSPRQVAKNIASFLNIDYNLEVDKEIDRFIISGIKMKIEKKRLRTREKIKSYYNFIKDLWKTKTQK